MVVALLGAVVQRTALRDLFGFRIGIGALPLSGRTTTASIGLGGLGVEHPVFAKTRVFGEYEWLWLIPEDTRAMTGGVLRPERHGSGHRATVGLRRELLAKRVGRNVRMFVDGELGGGLALANDNLRGAQRLPAGEIGARLGYDMYSSNDDSPSRTFEVEILLRAVAVREGVGMMMGMGMLWGN